jgi:hypothetical protein
MADELNDPYKPSWINRLTSWVQRLPGTSWMYYAGSGLVTLLVLTAIMWIEAAQPVGTILLPHVYLTAAIFFILSVTDYFDQRAIHALRRIKPVLEVSDDQYLDFQYRLSHLRSATSILAGVLALVFVLSTELIGGGAYQMRALSGYPISFTLFRILYLICWWFFGVFIYHSIHQLRLINQIFSNYTHINLFRLEPLYGFSNIASLTAGSLIVLPYGFFLINPSNQFRDPISIGTYILITSVALATFLLPQAGIHRLQVAEKERMLDEAYRHYEKVLQDLHLQVSEYELENISKVSTAFSSLETEISTIKATSTWPWQPGTLRWLFTALLLPVLMWLVQYFLGQFLNA